MRGFIFSIMSMLWIVCSLQAQNMLINGSFEDGTTAVGGINAGNRSCDYPTYGHCFQDCPYWDHASVATNCCWDFNGSHSIPCYPHSPDHGETPYFPNPYHGTKMVYMEPFEMIQQEYEEIALDEQQCYDIRFKFRRDLVGGEDPDDLDGWNYEYRFYNSGSAIDYISDDFRAWNGSFCAPDPDFGRYTNAQVPIGNYPLSFFRNWYYVDSEILEDLGIEYAVWFDMNLTFYTGYNPSGFDEFAIDIKDIGFDGTYNAGLGYIGTMIDDVELIPTCPSNYTIDGLWHGGTWNAIDPVRALYYVNIGDFGKGWSGFINESRTEITAGNAITFAPGTYASTGSYVLAHIEYCDCNRIKSYIATNPLEEDREGRYGGNNETALSLMQSEELAALFSNTEEQERISGHKVISVTGQVLLNGSTLNFDKIRLLPAGVYFIVITYTDNTTKVLKFMAP